MRKLERTLRVFPRNEFVRHWGFFGLCHSCERAVESTAEINGQRFCRDCKAEKFPEIVTAIFNDSDATFACPAGACGADDLTLEGFWIGSCCENAASCVDDEFKYERLSIVNKIYEEARDEEDSAEEDVEEASEALEKAQNDVERIKEALQNAENAQQNAEEEHAAAKEKLEEKKAWRKKVQKRALVLAEDAMKEDNRDLDDEDDSEDEDCEEEEFEEEKDAYKCKVCFEFFDDEHQEAAIYPCGHKACFNCLSSLQPMVCPICRAPFAPRSILKLFNN
ncbi:Oidioi.mRNA.OKI2018_I69.PAR.g13104.t1.cds [Oikopleura dioica]|uniref:Oidioi.mRNA.OKI2018_I69.PAR.g13104.t1.cds n=1 Tax=Oikopleura dioica TaxID=34765 RepID=A0ABN7S747_OIKDI|nr:Oidioi.mRNA.OKI2018_I69.PAR.g13104.t1.cds [Oikopleura dioica]